MLYPMYQRKKPKTYEDGLLAGLRIALRIINQILPREYTRQAIQKHIQNVEELSKPTLYPLHMGKKKGE